MNYVPARSNIKNLITLSCLIESNKNFILDIKRIARRKKYYGKV